MCNFRDLMYCTSFQTHMRRLLTSTYNLLAHTEVICCSRVAHKLALCLEPAMRTRSSDVTTELATLHNIKSSISCKDRTVYARKYVLSIHLRPSTGIRKGRVPYRIAIRDICVVIVVLCSVLKYMVFLALVWKYCIGTASTCTIIPSLKILHIMRLVWCGFVAAPDMVISGLNKRDVRVLF